jgi:hypothetical protein
VRSPQQELLPKLLGLLCMPNTPELGDSTCSRLWKPILDTRAQRCLTCKIGQSDGLPRVLCFLSTERTKHVILVNNVALKRAVGIRNFSSTHCKQAFRILHQKLLQFGSFIKEDLIARTKLLLPHVFL